MAQIAPGVMHSAEHTANVSGTVSQSNGAPVAGAEVSLNGPARLSTKSDDRGSFSFRSVPWGTYDVVVTSSFGTAVRNGISVNGDIMLGVVYPPSSSLQTIARVSTTGVGAHINVTSSSISSTSPSDYAFQGNGTWTQLFAQIPGVAVSGYSFGGNNSLETIAGAPQAPVVLSLNGALPYETSTTLDGMPLQGTSATNGTTFVGGGADLSNLPLNAFTTADIVRGPGANAPSIVDSIGGSFVLHAPEEVAHNQFEFSVSNDPYGGIVSNAKLALRLTSRLSATVIYGINDSPGPLGSGSMIPALSNTPLAINGASVNGSLYEFPSTGRGIANCYCQINDTMLYCCLPQSTAWNEHSGAVAIDYEIAPSVTAEVFYAGTTSQQNSQGGYFPVAFTPSAASPPYSGNYAPSAAGQPTYAMLDTLGSALGTQSGSLLEEKVTAYLSTGVLRLAALQYNTFSYSNYDLNPASGLYRSWGTADIGAAPGTPTAYNGTLETLTFASEPFYYAARANNRDFLISYATPIGPSSSVSASYVTSYYNNPYDESVLYGTIPIYSLSQSSAVSETTGELRLHIETQMSDRLALGLSWYNSVATYHVPVPSGPNNWANSVFPYNAPRFGGVWTPNNNIAVRAAVGGGYALPALYNLTGYSLFATGTSYDETVANLSLKPEETFGWDIGADMRLRQDTVLSFDLYRTNLYGQFFTSTTVSSLNGLPLYLEQFGNLGTSRYEGVNLTVHHNVPAGIYWNGNLGLTRGFVVSVPPGFYDDPAVPCTNCANQYVVPGANFTSAVYPGGVPYASGSATLGYRWQPYKYIDLSATYYGNNNIYNLPHAFFELDAHAGFAITRNVALLATFRNVTGVDDRSVTLYNPSYVVPVIAGAPANYPGVAFEVPYGPRSLVITALVKY